jgi:hypothetical protein
MDENFGKKNLEIEREIFKSGTKVKYADFLDLMLSRVKEG